MVALCTIQLAVQADGGVVIISEQSGPFIVTVFASPSPLTTGLADISVMVQDRTNQQQVLDATVTVKLFREDGSAVVSPALREQSQNRLLYAATMDVPESGSWHVLVTVSRGENTATVSSLIEVAEPWPPLVAYWRFLVIPPVAVALFLANQYLRRRRSRSTRGDHTAA